MLLIKNHVMSERDKRRSNNEKVMFQKWIVITLQEMKDHDEDSRKKENKKDTKEIYWTDFSRNHKHVNSLKKFNHVFLQAWKRKHHTSCSKFRQIMYHLHIIIDYHKNWIIHVFFYLLDDRSVMKFIVISFQKSVSCNNDFNLLYDKWHFIFTFW